MVNFGHDPLPPGRPRIGAPGGILAADRPPASGRRFARGVETARLSDLTSGRPAPGPLRTDHHLIMLVTVGQGSHALDFTRYVCRPGTLLWGRPGQVHQFGAQPGLDATLLAFHDSALPGSADLSALRHLVNDPFAAACWLPTGEDEEAIVAEVSQIATDCHRYGEGPGTEDDIATTLLRHQLAVLLVRIAGLSPLPPTASAATDLLRRLRAELEREVVHRRVERYAQRLGCSVRTLTRACLAATGRSAKQLIDERIALEGKRLLATSDLPVAEVGRRLGFDEPTNFGRFFAREAGQTPGAFRAAATRLGPAPAVLAQRSSLPGRLEPLAHRPTAVD